MSARTVSADSAARAIGPYSQGIAAAGLLFLSGQGALDPKTGALVQGTIREEVERVLENLKAVLEAAGTGLDRVARTTVYLTSLKGVEAVNEGDARYFGGNRPARSTVQVAALPKGARVEIDAIAILG